MGCQAASVHGTTVGLADQRYPIDQGHVREPWKRKGQTLPPPKPTVRASALALNAWTSVGRYSGDVFNRQRADFPRACGVTATITQIRNRDPPRGCELR